jgi:WD40 repeat protein
VRHVEHKASEQGHFVRVRFLDEDRLVTMARDAGTSDHLRLRVWRLGWDAAQQELDVPLEISAYEVFGLSVAADGHVLVVGRKEDRTKSVLAEVSLTERPPSVTVLPSGWRGDDVLDCAVATHGSDVIVASSSKGNTTSRVWRVDRRDGSAKALFGLPFLVRAIEVSGDLLAVVSDKETTGNGIDQGRGHVMLWDLATGQEVWSRDFEANLYSVSIVPGDAEHRVALGCGGGFVAICGAEAFRFLVPASQQDAGVAVPAHTGTVYGVVHERSGRLWSVSGHLRSGLPSEVDRDARDGEIRAWSRPASPGAPALPIEERTRPEGGYRAGLGPKVSLGGCCSIDLSPDGRAIVVGDDQGQANVWILPSP